jgi:hypothetical protein
MSTFNLLVVFLENCTGDCHCFVAAVLQSETESPTKLAKRGLSW